MRTPVERALEVCLVEVAVSVLGGTWKLTIVKHLQDGPRRFNELGRSPPLAGPEDPHLTAALVSRRTASRPARTTRRCRCGSTTKRASPELVMPSLRSRR